MEQDVLLYQVALGLLYQGRLSRAHQLLDHYDSAVEAWQAISDPKKKESLRRAEAELTWMQQHGIEAYYFRDERYPYRLAECPDAPIVLFTKGNLHVNEGKMVSIVGTRASTDRGRELTRKFVHELHDLAPDVTIISGLAYGIDVAAHKAAIEVGLPTIIVPGHGLDRIYPQIHRNVAVTALQNGGLLTEYPGGTEPFRQNFVARDRIIAGLADAVVVVESKERGGSLITAQMALDYNRQVFAFPGRAMEESSRGCNQLIRDQKAALIENAEDFVSAMMWENHRHTPIQTELIELTQTLDETEQKLLYKLREYEDGLHINLLMMELDIPYNKLSATLMTMELDGLVKSLPGGIYRALK